MKITLLEGGEGGAAAAVLWKEIRSRKALKAHLRREKIGCSVVHARDPLIVHHNLAVLCQPSIAALDLCDPDHSRRTLLFIAQNKTY